MIPRIEKNTVEFVRLSRLYAARDGAHPALAAYPTLDALLSALVGRQQADAGTRRRLICAVIVEHQAAPGPLGAAIVLHAFRGMLVHLSKSLRGIDAPDEADAFVAAGLLEALKRVRPERDPDRIGMYVRQETRRTVFAALKRDARARQYSQADEEGSPRCDDTQPGEEPPGEDESPSCAERGEDEVSDEPLRDPLALERASRLLGPDAVEDPETSVPLEDRMFLYGPTVDNIPDETLLRAQAVRGGLRRLTDHLFDDATARERETVYRQLVRRTERLLASTK